jgi:hypothetical protein
MSSGISRLAEILERAGFRYAVIGAHAVNAWLEPRYTADIDVTVELSAGGMSGLKDILATHGFALSHEHGADLPSGPDFVRFTTSDRLTAVELQVSKTAFQQEVIRRARREGGVRVASPEDLIVMKLIADRPKDQIDLEGLRHLPGLDWGYIEQWASEWGVLDRLAQRRR